MVYFLCVCVSEGVLRKGNELTDTVADLLPDSVPRSTAKIAITIVGVALAWFLIQKVLNFTTFLHTNCCPSDNLLQDISGDCNFGSCGKFHG